MTWISLPAHRDWYKTIGSGDLAATPVVNNSSGAGNYGLWAGLQFQGGASASPVTFGQASSNVSNNSPGPPQIGFTASASDDWDLSAGQALVVVIAYQKLGSGVFCRASSGVATYSSTDPGFDLVGSVYVSAGVGLWSASIQAYVSTVTTQGSNHISFDRNEAYDGIFGTEWHCTGMAYKLDCDTGAIDRGGTNSDGFNTFYNAGLLTESSLVVSSDRTPAPSPGRFVITSFMFNRHTTSETLDQPSSGGWTAASAAQTPVSSPSAPCPAVVAASRSRVMVIG